ncbi:hypothetical protein ILYODFUR_038523 [Ilyodon furcidens]|uniref:Secreted protein n=1 Tax=Ilyodon furcidens TaxID=33524 RepID=A0ABV0UPF2_9TELE
MRAMLQNTILHRCWASSICPLLACGWEQLLFTSEIIMDIIVSHFTKDCQHQFQNILFLQCVCFVCSVFALTAVDSLDASVISRFLFSPTRAGTKINTSEISWNTSQC